LRGLPGLGYTCSFWRNPACVSASLCNGSEHTYWTARFGPDHKLPRLSTRRCPDRAARSATGCAGPKRFSVARWRVRQIALDSRVDLNTIAMSLCIVTTPGQSGISARIGTAAATGLEINGDATLGEHGTQAC
jgi:hypothetical protein